MQPIRDVNLLLRLNHFVVLAMPANLNAGIASAINSAIRKTCGRRMLPRVVHLAARS